MKSTGIANQWARALASVGSLRRRALRALTRPTLLRCTAALMTLGAQASAQTPSTGSNFLSSLRTATNGSLVIPIRDSSGQLKETMVLLPVQARVRQPSSSLPTAEPTPTNPLFRPGLKALTNRVEESTAALTPAQLEQRTLEIQAGLVRRAISPGSMDGIHGSQTRAALRIFQKQAGLEVSGQPDPATWQQLTGGGEPLLTNYVVTATDLERLLPLGKTWLAKSQQARMDYESILELVAEHAMSHPNLVRRLNPGVLWTNVPVGAELVVPNVQYPNPAEKAASIRIRLADRTLEVFGTTSNLLAHFPCSIAQRVEKRPAGERLQVTVVAPNPNYTFDPAVFPESEEARQLGRKLILQPGPNNPVGAVWIGLDKPGYGIHGTPKPEEVGRTESHGCFRLANWNAEYLLKLVVIGTPIFVDH